ncbi:MAG: carboxypeptidase regulatory-like domain-containing protein [Bacteroidaceae bacterium]|nr:carboxypeptidase regulatory-like domain-containing protein [Bacteroidaceae bacterium]
MKKLILPFLMSAACISAFAQGTVRISGRVTDFDGKPVGGCAVMLMDRHNKAVDSVSTDKEGFYVMKGVKPGKYMALTAIKWDEYVRFSRLPEQDRRLEFWAWNIIADKDLTINPHYHRLELYGTTAFSPTGTNALMVYTRPMSATEAMKYDEKLYRDNNNGVIDYSVRLEDFKVRAFVDDKEVAIRHIENMTEQYGNQKMGAFVMMLDYHVRHDDMAVHQIRIVAENVKYHEKGENICFFQNTDFQ